MEETELFAQPNDMRMNSGVQVTQEVWFPALGDVPVIGLLGPGKDMAKKQ